MGKDISQIRGRLNETYVFDYRNSMVDRLQTWKQRINRVDRMLRGQFTLTYQDGTQKTVRPKVMNLGDAMSKDVARLVNESHPTIRSTPKSDKDKDLAAAEVREAIAETLVEENRVAMWTPQSAMDLIVAGAAINVCWIDDRADYPHTRRIDPRFAYPSVINGQMQDLAVVQAMPARVADRMYPEAGVLNDQMRMKDSSPMVEVWDYYSEDECITAVSLLNVTGTPAGKDNVYIVRRWHPDIGCPPAAMIQLPSFDGAFRGLLDQMPDALEAKNKMVELALEYTEQFIAAPFEAKGIINWDDLPGPKTVYQHDPNNPDSRIGRVAPAAASPSMWQLLEYMDTEQRGIGYPASRQGEVSQSIASGTFVSSTQGQLTSIVREDQGLLGYLLKDTTEILMKLDQKYKSGMSKDLVRPIRNQYQYDPEKDIAGNYRVNVLYGASAGLDRLNGDVRVLQHLGAKLISHSTARNQIDYLKDPAGEEDLIEREDALSAAQQKLLVDPNTPYDLVIELVALMGDGKSFMEAAVILKDKATAIAEQQRAQQAGAGAPGAPGAGPPGMPPEGPPAAEQQMALQKGGPAAPTTPGIQPELAKPPLEQIIAR